MTQLMMMGSSGGCHDDTPFCVNGSTSNTLATSGWKTANRENWTIAKTGASTETYAGAGDLSVSVGAIGDTFSITLDNSCGITANGDIRFRFPAPTLGVGSRADIEVLLLTQDGLTGYSIILTNDAAKTQYGYSLATVAGGFQSTIIEAGTSPISFNGTGGLQIRLKVISGVQYIQTFCYDSGNWNTNITSTDANIISPINSTVLYPVIKLSRNAASAPIVEVTVHISSIETSNDASLT